MSQTIPRARAKVKMLIKGRRKLSQELPRKTILYVYRQPPKLKTPPSSKDVAKAAGLSPKFERSIRRLVGPRKDVVRRYRKAAAERKRQQQLKWAAEHGW